MPSARAVTASVAARMPVALCTRRGARSCVRAAEQLSTSESAVDMVDALAMMATGVLTALAWRQAGLHGEIFEGMPGMLAGLAVYAVPTGWVAVRGRRLAATRS